MPAMRRLPFFTDEHRRLAAKVDGFCDADIATRCDRDEHDTDAVSREYVRALADASLLRFFEPLDVRACCLIRERLAYGSPLADDLFAMQGLGGIPIARFGTPEQKSRWLTAIENGAIGAFALTEPEAGSDPAGMQLRAECDGPADDPRSGYRLTGEKTLISNAGIADIYVVFARAADAPNGEARFMALIVPGDTPGLTFEPVQLLSAHPIGTMRFDGVSVPTAQRLGAEGDGLRIALATLIRFRATVGAAACGMARRALDEALAHVQSRRQFGRPLAKFQAVQFMLADMATELDAAQLLVARAAWLADNGDADGDSDSKPNAKEEQLRRAVSMAKLFATDHAHGIIDRAVQLFGGRGLIRGNPVERLYRDIRALRIYEGASEIQRLIIARTLVDKG